ncbi:hypothetical protein [Robertmurraya korlensis]|uniref:hypothetical protein n=1 Tax=Robertmurraya korlensis TaxID=519977 RepID=UPI0008245953|nr:hypothetical protein [Robertmurraya korlensis]
MKNWFTKQQLLVFAVIGFIVLGITCPFWLWSIKSNTQLNVLILDKTVPDQTYREHSGLTWLLNNEKYVTSERERYSIENSYSGFVPKEGEEYEIRTLPKELGKYDVFYLADSYGVYEKEFYGENQQGERSEHLYGGLLEEEVDAIHQELLSNNGKTLIAEFNTFASPTSTTAREKVSNLLNVDWTGWIGRYFPELEGEEVPTWVKENYEKSNGVWNFTGEGLVFVNSNDYIVVIDKDQFKGEGPSFQYTALGEKQFKNKKNDAYYSYWFDVISARDKDEILATYQLSVTKEGESKLIENGIPVTFPAVINHKNASYSAYYFAGDYADEGDVPSLYQTRGISNWREIAQSDSFYWRVYVPMMKQILRHGLEPSKKQEKVELVTENGTTINSKTNETSIQIQKDGKWEDLLIKGVNMGIAKPGYFPGETAISKDEYSRWFKLIGAMNANTIRIYTIHPPQFYEAFYEYNQQAKNPLYLFHGAWVTEETLLETNDAYHPSVVEEFQKEMKDIVDIVHGNAVIKENPGHASGSYTHDISSYVLGYIIGIEWDPGVVVSTDAVHSGMEQFKGNNFYTEKATPFEAWLANRMDDMASYEAETYKWQHSMSFTNWVTTDLLSHPAEPAEEEDMVSVNPNHIKKTNQFHGGLFASYHVYPYFPDFLNFEEDYVNYVDISGEKNNYAGYLHDLNLAHEMPVVIAEYGVPSSRGLTHENVHGMDQGNHSEQEQGNINQKLFKSIVSENLAGGMVFSWQDEWFKRTWNTMDFDNPDRRPYWSNIQTNEQMFGMLGFSPSSFGKEMILDGRDNDWSKSMREPLVQSDDEDNVLKRMYVTSDAANIYVRLDYHQSINLKETPTYITFDTIEDQGQKQITLNGGQSVSTTSGVDFLATLAGKEESRITVDSYYDSFYYQYGERLKLIPTEPYPSSKDNGIFHPIRLALNKQLTIPSTGQTYPFEAYETGKLQYGSGNPNDKNYNSLTDVSISEDGKMVEMRIPWLMLNVKDPSQKEIIGDMWKTGLKDGKNIDRIYLSAFIITEKGLSSLPVTEEESDTITKTVFYDWKKWEQPVYSERLKDSYYIMKETYGGIK